MKKTLRKDQNTVQGVYAPPARITSDIMRYVLWRLGVPFIGLLFALDALIWLL